MNNRVEYLARLSLGESEDLYREGRLSQVEYEAYRHAWAWAGGARMGYSGAVGWSGRSGDPDVNAFADALVIAGRKGRR